MRKRQSMQFTQPVEEETEHHMRTSFWRQHDIIDVFIEFFHILRTHSIIGGTFYDIVSFISKENSSIYLLEIRQTFLFNDEFNLWANHDFVKQRLSLDLSEELW